MSITRDDIEAHRKQLEAERDQLQANLYAYNGAIQNCEHWLRFIDEKANTPNVVLPSEPPVEPPAK